MSKMNVVKQKYEKKFAHKINPCYGWGQNHYKECPFRMKECFNCGQKDHKHTHYRKPKNKKGTKVKSTVNSTKMENTEIKMKRNFVKVQMNNKEVKFLLNTGSDVTLINEQTWKKIGKPTLSKMEKIAQTKICRWMFYKCNIYGKNF